MSTAFRVCSHIGKVAGSILGNGKMRREKWISIETLPAHPLSQLAWTE